MFKSILTKTLHEKRWSMLFWALGVVAMSILMMGFYHSFQNFDQVLQNLPKSIRGLVGNADSLKTLSGYVSQQVFALRVPLLTLIMGVTLFTGLLAGDENQGTLQTLLAQPVSRTRVFIEKFLSGMVISFVICFGAFVGVIMGAWFIHEHIGLGLLFQAIVGVWLLTMVFGAFGYALGAITGKRGLAGAVAGLITFSSYLLTSFINSVPSIARVEKLSPFHYYNNPATTQYGLALHNVLVMVAIILILLVIAIVVFIKRDIYQR